jgi:hypothetical protein
LVPPGLIAWVAIAMVTAEACDHVAMAAGLVAELEHSAKLLWRFFDKFLCEFDSCLDVSLGGQGKRRSFSQGSQGCILTNDLVLQSKAGNLRILRERLGGAAMDRPRNSSDDDQREA